MNYNTVDFRKISFPEVNLNKQNKDKQYKLFPKYEDKYFTIKTPLIKITQYGIQSIHPDYYPTDESRNFFKLPLDNEEQSNKDFKNVLLKIDDYIERNKKRILKQFIKSNLTKNDFCYIPFVKKPENEKRQNNLKLKFNIDFQTKEYLTKVFINKEQQNVKNINDLEKICPYGSSVKLIILLNKLWISKTRDFNKKFKFGLTGKILQIKIEPSKKKKQLTYDEYAFED